MKKLLFILLVMAFLCVTGCDTGLEFEASKEIKQQGEVAGDLTGAIAVVGAEPGSPIAKMAASGARTVQTYVGQSGEPMNLGPVIQQQAEWNRIKIYNQVADEFRRKLNDKARSLYDSMWANFAKYLGDDKNKTIDKADVIAYAQQVNNMTGAIYSVCDEVKDEKDKTSPATVADVQELISNQNKIAYAGNKQAVKDPTAKDIAAGAQNWVDGAIDIVTENPTATGLLSIFGLGSVTAILKSMKSGKKLKEAELKQAQEQLPPWAAPLLAQKQQAASTDPPQSQE